MYSERKLDCGRVWSILDALHPYAVGKLLGVNSKVTTAIVQGRSYRDCIIRRVPQADIDRVLPPKV